MIGRPNVLQGYLLSVSTIEGFVEIGQIRVSSSVKLPENAKVYIVILDMTDVLQPVHIYTPR